MQLAKDTGGMLLVAEFEGQILPGVLGFSAFHWVDTEAELRNIAVAPAYRRQGIATALLEDGSRRLYAASVKKLFLEVRESNLPAIQLYRSLGFTAQSRRKDYYRNPSEDALVLVRQIMPPKA